jgi:hypothetical protein
MHFYFDRQHTMHHVRIAMKQQSTHTPTGAGDSAAHDLQTIAAESVSPCSHGGECMDDKLSRLDRDNDAVIVRRFGSKHFDWFTA